MSLVKTNILGWVYWWDRRDCICHSRRRSVICESCEMWVCTYVNLLGGGFNESIKKHRGQDYAISNQHLVCNFEDMGWDMFLRNHMGIYCALPHILVCVCVCGGGGGGGGDCNSIKIGQMGREISWYSCMILSKIEMYLAAEIIIIYQDFLNCIFIYGNLNHVIIRTPVHVI